MRYELRLNGTLLDSFEMFDHLPSRVIREIAKERYRAGIVPKNCGAIHWGRWHCDEHDESHHLKAIDKSFVLAGNRVIGDWEGASIR